MAPMLRLAFLLIVTVTIQLHHVDSQLSASDTKLSQIITLLEEVTGTSASFIPNLAVLLKNHDDAGNLTNSLLQNNTDKLDEVTSALFRIEEVLKLQQQKHDQAILTSVQTHQNTVSQIASIQSQTLNQMISIFEMQAQRLDNISSVLPHLVSLLEKQQDMQILVNLLLQNSAVTQMVSTQTRMAESLDQIVNLLQIKNQTSEAVLSQPGNTADPQVQQQLTMSSPTPTIVETTNVPINAPPRIPIDCSNISAADNQGSGVYTIDPSDGLGPFQVYCNMDTDDGGWTVFQKRFDGSVDFFLAWLNYEQGFGNVQGEHWLGLQQVHRMTRSGGWTLRINLEDFDGDTRYAQYDDFNIGDAASFYQLSVGAFSGNVVDTLSSHHNGKPFSTKDRDHDNWTVLSYDGSCAVKFQSGWWFHNCLGVNLNGLYQGSSTVPNHAASKMSWEGFPVGSYYGALKKSEMKIRRVQ